MSMKSLIKLMNCHQCGNGNVMGICMKKKKVYINNKWHISETPIFLCKKHFLDKQKLNKVNHDIFTHNQKIIKNLSIVSKIKIKNNLGSDMIDQIDLELLINGLKYIKEYN